MFYSVKVTNDVCQWVNVYVRRLAKLRYKTIVVHYKVDKK